MSNKDSMALEIAKEAMRNFVRILQKELTPLAYYWESKPQDVCILWLEKDRIEERAGFYGCLPGFYLLQGDPEIGLHFCKTTNAYLALCTAIECVHKDNDEVSTEWFPESMDVHFDGEDKVKVDLTINMAGLDQDEYPSVKAISEEMVNLFDGIENVQDVKFYESDDDGNVGFSEECDNYYVGLTFCFNYKKVRLGFKFNA